MLSLLHEDGEILVLDKPAGLASQPGAGVGTSLVEAVERDFGFRPFLVHRLDKETAGCIIVARSSRAAAVWTGLIAGREVRKVYRAVAAGRPPAPRGVFRDAVKVRGEGKAAETAWRLLGAFPAPAAAVIPPSPEAPVLPTEFSYLELELGTGRTHQIRLHLAQAGLPILGDDQHGNFRLNKLLRKELGLKRLLLLAYRLELPGGPSLCASIPDHLRDFLAACPGAPDPEEP